MAELVVLLFLFHVSGASYRGVGGGIGILLLGFSCSYFLFKVSSIRM
jgi:hypothetical protein